jgi:hypothetical protein
VGAADRGLAVSEAARASHDSGPERAHAVVGLTPAGEEPSNALNALESVIDSLFSSEETEEIE